MDVILFEIFTEVRPLQPKKAPPPMVVTLLGMVTDVRPLQSRKASPPIEVTPFPIVKEVSCVKFLNGETS